MKLYVWLGRVNVKNCTTAVNTTGIVNYPGTCVFYCHHVKGRGKVAYATSQFIVLWRLLLLHNGGPLRLPYPTYMQCTYCVSRRLKSDIPHLKLLRLLVLLSLLLLLLLLRG